MAGMGDEFDQRSSHFAPMDSDRRTRRDSLGNTSEAGLECSCDGGGSCEVGGVDHESESRKERLPCNRGSDEKDDEARKKLVTKFLVLEMTFSLLLPSSFQNGIQKENENTEKRKKDENDCEKKRGKKVLLKYREEKRVGRKTFQKQTSPQNSDAERFLLQPAQISPLSLSFSVLKKLLI